MKFMEVQTVNKSKRQSRRVTRDPQSTPYRFCWTGRPTSERLTEDVVARHSVGTFFNDAPGELGMDIRPSIEPLAATAAAGGQEARAERDGFREKAADRDRAAWLALRVVLTQMVRS